MIQLCDVVDIQNGNLITNGEFQRLDYCTVNENGPFLTFLEKEKYITIVQQNQAISCLLCKSQFIHQIPGFIQGVYITEEPKVLFSEIHNRLANNPEYALPNFPTRIGSNCKISPLAWIASQNVIIEDNVTIGPFSYVGEHVTIRSGCILHNHVTIGGKGFACTRKGWNEVIMLEDCGSVLLDRGVEILSYTHLACGTLPTDTTYIGEKSVLDAFVQVSHGVHIGERVFVAANVVIGGNTMIGKDTWIGLSANISNRITIGDRSRVSLGAVVTKNVEDDSTVTGNFAIEHSRFISNLKKQISENDQIISDHQ